MKKIGIITIVSMNFGNRLQNYALQKILEDIGCSVYTLKRSQPQKGIKYIGKLMAQTLLQSKGAKFRQFDKLIHFSDEVISRDSFPANISNLYNYFIVGSDQVWNPYYDFVAGKCDFLAFARNEQKVSYAASFGVDEIPGDKVAIYSENLLKFKAISVREDIGATIVNKLTGRDAQVVLDPTMLLTSKEWEKVEKKQSFIPKKEYVLVYALGEKNEAFENKIQSLKSDYQIFDIRSTQSNGREIPVGPAEFLYLIHHANIILTDSFHASVFSILYHKKFITFNRLGLNMNSRISSLARIIGMEHSIDDQGNFYCDMKIDYQKTDKFLETERVDSINFLKKALEG